MMTDRVKSLAKSKMVEIASNVTCTTVNSDPLLRSPSGGGGMVEAPGLAMVAGSSRLSANLGLKSHYT